MKKRVTVLIALVAVLVVAAVALAACDIYKQNSIGMGDSDAAVVSNGGYYVEQGDYAYFINGYVGSVTSNEWGAAYKQAIMRAKINEDGTYDVDNAQIVVPLSIYNTYAAGGFAVYGDWIYYATPNTEEDKTGTASTTYTDFMRTRTDGAVTQKIGTVTSRSYNYLFTPTRILYYDGSSSSSITVRYFDFTGMSTDKSVDNGKGAKGGVLIENATSVVWGYDAGWTPGAGASVSDYVFYTRSLTGDDSYKHYNELCAVRYDGTDARVLATAAEDAGVDAQFTYSLSDITIDSDQRATLYYTKSVYNYESSSETSTGLYINTFDITNGFSADNEKKLVATAPTSFYPLGYEEGMLATKGDAVYRVSATDAAASGDVYTEANRVIARSEVTVEAVVGNYVYYSASNVLYRIDTTGNRNEEVIVAEGVRTDWLEREFVGGKVFFFNTADYEYLNYVSLPADDEDAAEPVLLGKMTQADLDAKAEAEKEEE